jgi:hypothetical protein
MVMKMQRALLQIVIVTMLLAISISGTTNSKHDTNFRRFKEEMMPRVGKRITIEGVLDSGKLGWLVRYKEWGIYIYGQTDKMNALNRFYQRPVKATGTLKHFVDNSPCPPARACAPEHFFFDVAEVNVISSK